MRGKGSLMDDDFVQSKIDARLREELLEKKSSPVPVIIQMKDVPGEEDRLEIEKMGGRIRKDLAIINAFSVVIPSDGIHSLAFSPRVKKIYLDGKMGVVVH
ncbi:MAG: hypothetical protein V2A78_08995 [bacterium]